MGKVEFKVEVDEVLAEQLRAAEIHTALVMERALKASLGAQAAEERARKWRETSAETIAAHNRFVEEHGEFGKAWRNW